MQKVQSVVIQIGPRRQTFTGTPEVRGKWQKLQPVAWAFQEPWKRIVSVQVPWPRTRTNAINLAANVEDSPEFCSFPYDYSRSVGNIPDGGVALLPQSIRADGDHGPFHKPATGILR